jgi:hypothetical protein
MEVRYFSRFNPLVAIRDLRVFLSHREKHELWFGVLAIVLTTLLLAGFVVDSRVQREYKPPEVMFVKSWSLDRSDQEIIAQQKLDMIEADKRVAAWRKAQLERQQQFKRLDDQLKSVGL